jgi:hypothetical protein
MAAQACLLSDKRAALLDPQPNLAGKLSYSN